MRADSTGPGRLPAWVPDAVRDYIRHTRDGRSIRALARDRGCEPSTVLRRVRRIENRRDDPLVDSALQRLGRFTDPSRLGALRRPEMIPMKDATDTVFPDETKLEREAARVLRRLAEQGACLALAPAMDTAVVVRETGAGPALRTAVVERMVAEAMALRDWIQTSGTGRILRYRITAAGRAELKRLVAQEESQKAKSMGSGMEFAEFQGDFAHRATGDDTRRHAARYSLAESPLVSLGRRRDKEGKPFLTEDLVAAGERLREDFELAQVGTRVTQNWDHFLTSAPETRRTGVSGGGSGAEGARARVQAALAALGPGLGDVALRCCCFLEGLETAERRMGWSARSGKIVLRIALQRLKAHYDANSEHWSPLIG